MPRNKHLIAAGFFPLLTVSCDFPWRECACTQMACLEGITVELLKMPDSAEWSDVALSVEYGDTVEAASNQWNFGSRDRQTFASRKLVAQKPASIRLHLDYRADGSENRITLDTTAQWKARVCNGCSGSSPSCKDDMAHTADLTWDLSEVAPLAASGDSRARLAQPSPEVAIPFRQ